MSNGEPDWTEEQIDRLMEMKGAGDEWNDIAVALGRSKNACCQKYTQVRERARRINDQRMSGVFYGAGTRSGEILRCISAPFRRESQISLHGCAAALCVEVSIPE
jgi:hypothetical protein